MISDYNEGRLPSGFTQNGEQIQNAYRLAYFLHPQDDVAFSVLNEGFDKAHLLAKTIGKRPYSDNPHKIPLRSEDLLHVGVMFASELFEIYQELSGSSSQRGLSRYANTYQPTLDDFVIRYIKTIYINSSDRTARYLAIEVGTLVYRYKTVDILGISDYFDNNNSSKIKKFFENSLADRFPTINLRQSLTTNERVSKLIECCFDIFTLPSVRNANFNQVSNVRDEYFSYNSEKSEREKFDVLMKFGLSRLIDEYNSYLPYRSQVLSKPIDKLMLPETVNSNFKECEQSFKSRLQDSQLTAKEVHAINTFLGKSDKRISVTESAKQTDASFRTDDVIHDYLDELSG